MQGQVPPHQRRDQPRPGQPPGPAGLVQVSLPAGLDLAVDELVVSSAFGGEVSATADGLAELRLNTLAVGLVELRTSAGSLVALNAFPKHPDLAQETVELSATSTAKSLLWLSLAPELAEPRQAAASQALMTRQDGFPALVAALETAMLAEVGAAGRPPNEVLEAFAALVDDRPVYFWAEGSDLYVTSDDGTIFLGTTASAFKPVAPDGAVVDADSGVTIPYMTTSSNGADSLQPLKGVLGVGSGWDVGSSEHSNVGDVTLGDVAIDTLGQVLDGYYAPRSGSTSTWQPPDASRRTRGPTSVLRTLVATNSRGPRRRPKYGRSSPVVARQRRPPASTPPRPHPDPSAPRT